MATVIGTVISIALDTAVKKQGGGTYQGWELVYKSNEGEVRTIAKPVTSLKFNQALAKELQALKAGDVFTLTQEKNQAGFNDVKSITLGADLSSAPPARQATGNTGGTAGAARSTYETPEERAVRQRLIVRQSSLTAAIDILKNGDKKTPLNLANVAELAEDLVTWVFETQGKDAGNFDDLGEDIPY
jgi:hypothetical protein